METNTIIIILTVIIFQLGTWLLFFILGMKRGYITGLSTAIEVLGGTKDD